ncbi:uncharacterized protein LOC111699245 [Eurytemora carolleeae]|uniref:uncharacterized protein LOC111699245 n=1 Tax=Eurytemora carolleeae TaxID=1294199 RepID=UPI000C7625A0|nr:uncharacterized protein LOC111699245 [Eurytemora carolleeae]|eukprot:XP_023325625.1 uncharacterized protein LOC111699245 [Eurytemora affinis]
MIVSQLVRPHRSSCLLGQLTKAFGERVFLCGEIEQSFEVYKARIKTPKTCEATPDSKDRILLSGDIESNPGPPRRSIAEKGPSTEEKVASIEASLSTYEAKIQGLEHEIESQKDKYEKTIEDLGTRILSLEGRIEEIKDDATNHNKTVQESFLESMEKLKEESREKILEISERISGISEECNRGSEEYGGKFAKVEENFNILQVGLRDIQEDNHDKLDKIVSETNKTKEIMGWLEGRVKDSKVEYTGKIHELAHVSREQRREYKAKFLDMDTEYTRLKERMETMNQMLDEVQEKLYEFEQNKKNNLIFHGVLAEHPETSDSLNQKVAHIIKSNISIKREIPISKASRVFTGPDVRGTRPVLVTFESFKDRDEVLRKARMLKKANIHVEEDLSKRTRENRNELRKFMRQIRKANPERNCFLQYDKLYLDNKIYVYNEVLAQVVEHTESVRFGEMISRPGSSMVGSLPSFYGPSRPGSRTGSRPASGAGGGRGDSSTSSIPKLPPLNKQHSISLPSMVDYVDPRDVKLNELERVINQYQERLADVTTNYISRKG